MKKINNILFFLLLFCQSSLAQITIDKTTPYDSPTWLVNNILLGGGVVASNHSYQGDSMQIGFFNSINTNLGLDSGIVMATGDIDLLDPNFTGFGANPPNTVTDPDLLAVANSVPPLIGQTFVVSSINDVAILEFDFIPTSDTVKFRYVFGSQEYFGFENSQYNDVFGFFLSGPGIIGPYSSPPTHPNGSVNLAIVPGSNPPLPITISSVHNGGVGGIFTPMNAQYFVDNSGTGLDTIADADGYTTVLTAVAVVQCAQTYHIRLAIADGSDQGLSSYVWLEAGSFTSPTLDIADNFGIDSSYMVIPCNATITLTADGGVGATYQWYDSTNTIISTDSTVIVGPGSYWVAATSVGCAVYSDTLTVFALLSPSFELGIDYNIACNDITLIDPTVSGGTPPYSYNWNTGSSDTSINVGGGSYILLIIDTFGCNASDTITILEYPPPSFNLGSDYNVACNDITLIDPTVSGGTPPYSYNWNTGSSDTSINTGGGSYILLITDSLGCNVSDTITILEDAPPTATISGGGSVCDDGTMVSIDFNYNGLLPWNLSYTDGVNNFNQNALTSTNFSSSTLQAGDYTITQVTDLNGCVAIVIGLAQVQIYPLPNAVITPGDTSIYIGQTLIFSTGNYAFYKWFNDEDSLLGINQQIEISQKDSFYVWVEDDNGCTDVSEFVFVSLLHKTELFVPTAFTPNGDEHNDLFVIKGKFIKSFQMDVVNRWGEVLFTSNSIEKYWDGKHEGKAIMQGTYYYNITILGQDNNSFVRQGTVEVIY